MSRQGRLGIFGVLLFASLSLSGRTHASNCVFPPLEILDLELEAVTVDGVAVNPSEYATQRGRLDAEYRGFWLNLLARTGGVMSVEGFGVE